MMMSGATQGIKIVSEANLSCAASQPDILARRTFVNLDTTGWSGGLATVLPQDMGAGGGAGPLKEELDLEEERGQDEGGQGRLLGGRRRQEPRLQRSLST